MHFDSKTILFALVLAFFGCKNEQAPTAQKAEKPSSEKPEKAPEKDARKTVLFFGNSLTAAYGLKPEEGFPALVQQKIDSLGLAFRVVDAGVSGNTTADGASRIDWVLQQPIDVFVLELGGNDALRGLPVAESKKNLQKIIDAVRLKNPACRIIVAGMQAPPNMGKKYASDFQKIFPELAKTNGLPLIPFLLEGVGGERDLNQKDGIHPTAKGQKIVAANVWAVLFSVLKN